MQSDLVVGPGVVVPGAELAVTFSRSGGPGGQNVNKVSSRVTLSFDLLASGLFTADQKARIATRAGRRLSTRGVLSIVSQTTRDQHRNVEDARERLRALLESGLRAPKPRRPTRVTKAAKRARLEEKRRHAQTKRARSTKDFGD